MTVLETSDLAELTVVQSLLEAEGVPFVVVGEEAVRLGPMRAINPLFGLEPPKAKIQVGVRSADEVTRMLADLELDEGSEPAGTSRDQAL